MSTSLFVPSLPLLHCRTRRSHRHIIRLPQCTAEPLPVLLRTPIPTFVLAPTQRSARVSVLTDFSSSPLAAVADRVRDPLSVAMLILAAVLGSFVTFVVRPSNSRITAPESIVSDAASVSNDSLSGTDDDGVRDSAQLSKPSSGENAIWLNMSLRTLWRLFRKYTNSLVKDVLQPVLDEMEFPDFVQSVSITGLTLGESPALVRKIKRLPSRSLSEIQYQFGVRLVGDKDGQIEMKAVVRIPGIRKDVAIPLTVSFLDIDAKVWVGFTVIPYQPWISFAQWALMKMPKVKLKVQVAKHIPITTIPVLSNVLMKILTEDIPREFLFPKTKQIDLIEDDSTIVDAGKTLFASRGIKVGLEDAAEELLRAKFPDLVSLFDSLDVNDDGVLNAVELSDGLIEWGYASEADRKLITNLVDVNDDSVIELREFISAWGDLQSIFVPRRFRGVISGILLKAEGLRVPTFGATDPYVVLQVGSQSSRSKKNKSTSKTGKGKGRAVWNESWELFVEIPKTAVLTVEVREGCPFSYYKDYIAPALPPVTNNMSGSIVSAVAQASKLDGIIGYGSIPIADIGPSAKSVWVELTKGGGRVRLDVQFCEFVDPQDL